jgi:hypothetical protein
MDVLSFVSTVSLLTASGIFTRAFFHFMFELLNPSAPYLLFKVIAS